MYTKNDSDSPNRTPVAVDETAILNLCGVFSCHTRRMGLPTRSSYVSLGSSSNSSPTCALLISLSRVYVKVFEQSAEELWISAREKLYVFYS